MNSQCYSTDPRDTIQFTLVVQNTASKREKGTTDKRASRPVHASSSFSVRKYHAWHKTPTSLCYTLSKLLLCKISTDDQCGTNTRGNPTVSTSSISYKIHYPAQENKPFSISDLHTELVPVTLSRVVNRS